MHVTIDTTESAPLSEYDAHGLSGADPWVCEKLEHHRHMTTLFRADDGNLLTSVLAGEGVHLDPAAVLDGLTGEQAHSKPHGLPYSIADLVAHMCFWQEWFNACLESGFTGIPLHEQTAGRRPTSVNGTICGSAMFDRLKRRSELPLGRYRFRTHYSQPTHTSRAWPGNHAARASSARPCITATILARSSRCGG